MILTTRFIPAGDRHRLLAAADRALGSWITYAPYLDYFRRELRWSKAVSPEEVPDDMVTLDSEVELEDQQTGEIATYTLVLPEEVGADTSKVSVLSPMGVALYGARVGDSICWLSSTQPEVAAVRRLVYQPEAASAVA